MQIKITPISRSKKICHPKVLVWLPKWWHLHKQETKKRLFRRHTSNLTPNIAIKWYFNKCNYDYFCPIFFLLCELKISILGNLNQCWNATPIFCKNIILSKTVLYCYIFDHNIEWRNGSCDKSLTILTYFQNDYKVRCWTFESLMKDKSFMSIFQTKRK